MDDLFPVARMAPSSSPRPFPAGPPITLPDAYVFEGDTRNTDTFLTSTDTAALFVLQDGQVRYEDYWLTGGATTTWISWSVAKSFISALIGIAQGDGLLPSVDAPIDAVTPKLKGSCYEGVSIKNVLQMSSGARWSENYSDPNSEIMRFGAAISAGGSLDDFVAGMERATDPGTICQYNSADTQALGMMLTAATNRPIADYMQEKLCEPLGFEQESFWLVDSAGMEMAFGGVNLTARDYAKIGELFRNNGRVGDTQIVPAEWVAASLVPDAPHLQVGQVMVGGHVLPLGYGYQWWVPEGDRGEFSAIGVYNQFVFVDPSRNVTIVKLTANPAYGTSPDEKDNKEMETIEFIRAVAGVLD